MDRRFLRVQVKSTIYRRRGGEYSLNVTGPKRKRYPPGAVDFFAVYVIPLDEWYIIPYEAMGRRLTLHFTQGSKRAKWTGYREAWHLLRREPGGGTIFACADESEWRVVLVGESSRRRMRARRAIIAPKERALRAAGPGPSATEGASPQDDAGRSAES